MEVIALDSDGGGGGGGSGGGANQDSHAAGMTQEVALPELEQSNGEQMLTVKRIALVWRGGLTRTTGGKQHKGADMGG